ncbi:MAG: EamA family transporter, partial [Clostridia bacterium]|nr:EamA family transporter [Clostridia bacterium]
VSCVLSVAGVALISLIQTESGHTSFIVILLLLGAMFSATGFHLVNGGIAESFSAFEKTYMMFALSAFVFTVCALGECGGNVLLWAAPLREPTFLISVAYLGVASSVVAFFCVNYADTYLPISRSPAFSSLVTVVSVLVGLLLLDETASLSPRALPWVVGSCAVIVLGVCGVQVFSPKER